MTAQQIIVEVFEALGKPSDLSIYTSGTFDITTAGSVRILAWVNRAYKQLLFWKLPNGVHLRFDSTKGTLYFQSNVTDGTAQAGTAGTITLESGQVLADDALNGWVILITDGTGQGQKRVIIDSAVTTDLCTIHKDWVTNPDATSEYELYHHRYKVLDAAHAEVGYNIEADPVSEFFSPEMIHDLTSGTEINLSPNKWSMAGNRDTHGNPGVFFWDQGSVLFDKAPDAVRSYEVEYVVIPPDMTAVGDIPMMPEVWHDAVVLWALHRGLRRAQESSMAWAVKQDLKDMIRQIVQQREMQQDKQESQLEIYRYAND